MKKFVTLLLAGAMAASLAVTANAADYTAKKGTPEIDGKIDEIYKQSCTVKLDNTTGNFHKAGDGASSKVKSTSYYLWDENYIYIATEVTNDTEVVDAKVKDGWKSDAVETWLDLGKGVFKASIDAYSNIFGDVKSSGFDLKTLKGKGVVIDKSSYTVELAIPRANKASDSIPFSMQLNDVWPVDCTNIAAAGSQKAGDKLILSADAVVLPKKEEPKQAAATADPAALALLAAAASAAGIVVSKKKH